MASAFERIYPYVPVWLQNAGISLYGLAWRQHRTGGKFDRYVNGFLERDRWSAEQTQAYVQGELRRVLMLAWDQVPYYQQKWKGAGIRADELPQRVACTA